MLASRPTAGAPANRPPPRRGRPFGSQSRVLRDDRKLGIHHFAFVRAGLLGLDLRVAHERYLAWSDTCTDLRHIEHRHAELLSVIRSACLQLASSLPVGHPAHRVLADLQGRPSAGAKQLPTLDEWVEAEGLDRDFFGEAELVDEYNAAHGIDNAEAAEAAQGTGWEDWQGRAVKALNLAEQLIAARPVQQDSVDAWFAKPVARRLQAVGVLTLRDLVATINIRGRRWWRRSGVGERRGAQIVQWLLSSQDSLGIEIRPLMNEVMAKRDDFMLASDEIIMPPRFAVVPMGRLAVPPHLCGAGGVFRATSPNTLGATTDFQAIDAWLQRYRERPATLRSYRKEAERFLLWCLHVQNKPVSSVTSPDCQAYREFLSEVPAAWVNVVPVSRKASMWRPFRGQPSVASQKQALVIVQAMFEGLVASGYLTANPMHSVMKTFNLPPGRVQVQRSFSEAEVRHVRSMVEVQPPGPHQRRLRALIELLLSTGIRLDELTQAKRGDMRQVAVDGESELAWILNVIGKRRKLREVPVPDSVLELLNAHTADLNATPGGSPPLIAALGPGPGGNGEQGAQMSASGLYALLKRFLGRCARSAAASGLDSGHLAAASTHWLRHSFGRRAVVAGVPLEVISQAMGHASLTTTSVYLTQERSRMIVELRRVAK
jgi:site-specific recombinase XerD